MATRTNRREFARRAAASAAAGCMILAGGCSVRSFLANERLRVGLVGLGHRGSWFVQCMPRIGEEVVALCDVDLERAAEAFAAIPAAAQYQDYRRMLDEMDDRLDAVVVATPDHTHTVISAAAMRQGKHVYCEKPIARTVHEARTLRALAAETGLVTQMGNQGMATDEFRRTIERIEEGALGEIREAHVWYVFGGSGFPERPGETPPVPDHLLWDVWLGPALDRPYHPSYLSDWWSWRDFCGGIVGGGGSHSINVVFMGLKLGTLWEAKGQGTIRIEADAAQRTDAGFPHWQTIRYDIPARGDLPPLTLYWHNGPQENLRERGVWERLEKIAGRDLVWTDDSWTPESGTLLVGSRGVIHTNAHNSRCVFLPAADFPEPLGPPQRLPRSGSHEREWVRACKGGTPPLSQFSHSGPAMELLILGNVANLVEGPIEFDPRAMRILNHDQADRLLRPPYREGWSV